MGYRGTTKAKVGDVSSDVHFAARQGHSSAFAIRKVDWGGFVERGGEIPIGTVDVGEWRSRL